MTVIEQKAALIAEDVAKKSDVRSLAIDPFTIGIIITIITELVKLYMSCRKEPKSTAASMRHPGIMERWRLRKIVKRHIDDDEVYSYMGKELVRSSLKVASQVTDDEVKAMYDEVD